MILALFQWENGYDGNVNTVVLSTEKILYPPLAPSAEETKKVLKEYDKALLLNGPNGPLLSQLAIKIEHEANKLGLYKAFALLALPFGDGPT